MTERILVVEDDPSILRLVTIILERTPYDVDTATNGLEAIEKIELRDYDVVVLDLMMPRASGLDVLASLCLRSCRSIFAKLVTDPAGSAFEITCMRIANRV